MTKEGRTSGNFMTLQNVLLAVFVQGDSHAVQISKLAFTKQLHTMTLLPPCLTVDVKQRL